MDLLTGMLLPQLNDDSGERFLQSGLLDGVFSTSWHMFYHWLLDDGEFWSNMFTIFACIILHAHQQLSFWKGNN